MNRSHRIEQASRAAQAIDRVLGAERVAGAALTEARQQAEQALALARQDALAAVNRSQDRVATWQAKHARALQGRLAALRESALDSAAQTRAPDVTAISAAVARFAARLTGADAEVSNHEQP